MRLVGRGSRGWLQVKCVSLVVLDLLVWLGIEVVVGGVAIGGDRRYRHAGVRVRDRDRVMAMVGDRVGVGLRATLRRNGEGGGNHLLSFLSVDHSRGSGEDRSLR